LAYFLAKLNTPPADAGKHGAGKKTLNFKFGMNLKGCHVEKWD